MNELLRRLLFLPPQASSMAEEIDHLHYFVILTTMGGAVLITLVGGWFLIRYRRGSEIGPSEPHPGVDTQPPLWIEVAAVIFLFTLFLVWWVIGVEQYVHLRVSPLAGMEIYVAAKQWMWQFAYPEGGRSISVLYVPAGRTVKLVMTSRDVIHSFYVPDFRIKQDVVPGRYTTAWFEVKAPGHYPILCAEYCGAGHSTMRGEVIALEPEDFDRWLRGDDPAFKLPAPVYVPPEIVGRAEPKTALSLARQGERVAAEQGCFRCHSVDGTSYTGPSWAGLFGSTVPLEGGGTVLADTAYITESIMDPRAKIHLGYAPVMPSYQGKIGVGEMAAIVELLRSLRDAPQGGKVP